MGAALGARMVDHAIHHWGIAKKEPAMRVMWGPDGCINDALQAITGATSGNGRLDSVLGSDYVFRGRVESLGSGLGRGWGWRRFWARISGR